MLTLPIKKKWFDMILSGEKKEEYRELNSYYLTRFVNLGDRFGTSFEILLRNGYSKNSPTLKCLVSCSSGTGNVEWGAEKDKRYLVIKIHTKELLKE